MTHQSLPAVSGVLSTNGFGFAAYLAGTNRRAVRMVLRDAMCIDLEDLRDSTASEKYIMRDVGVHDPDGSVTTFKTFCKTCHGVMDQLATAFVYHDISKNAIVYNRIEPVPDSNKQMKVVNDVGFIPRNDEWRAEFTSAQLDKMGWPKTHATGFGVKKLGQAIANTEAFFQC